MIVGHQPAPRKRTKPAKPAEITGSNHKRHCKTTLYRLQHDPIGGTEMRRALLFVVSAAIILGGACLEWSFFRCMLGFTNGPCRVPFGLVFGGGSMISIAGYMLWDDLFGPKAGGKL